MIDIIQRLVEKKIDLGRQPNILYLNPVAYAFLVQEIPIYGGMLEICGFPLKVLIREGLQDEVWIRVNSTEVRR